MRRLGMNKKSNPVSILDTNKEDTLSELWYAVFRKVIQMGLYHIAGAMLSKSFDNGVNGPPIIGRN